MSLALLAMGASIAGDLYSKQSARKAEEKKIKALKTTALRQYASTEDAANIMKGAARSSAIDSVGEILRVGGAETRDTLIEIQKARSTSMAQTEGLTSGISKGRSARAFEIKANKILSQVKSKETSEISKILDAKDKVQNDLNNKLISAHNELQTTLAQKLPKADLVSDLLSVGTAAMSGYSAGTSIEGTEFGANIKGILNI